MGALLITREDNSDIAGASVPTEFDSPFPAAGTARPPNINKYYY